MVANHSNFPPRPPLQTDAEHEFPSITDRQIEIMTQVLCEAIVGGRCIHDAQEAEALVSALVKQVKKLNGVVHGQRSV